ncbi:MAG: hypothetical protein WCK36_03155, partial [Candidatus Firestonebacteria bacterium]
MAYIIIIFIIALAATVFFTVKTELTWPGGRLVLLLALRLLLLLFLAAWIFDLRFSTELLTKKIDLVVVADRSSSIGEKGIKNADELLAKVNAEGLKRNETVSLVEFGGEEK